MNKNLNGHNFITVLLPVYNSQNYLKEAIDSILQQSFTHFELLIINDGSTDKSLEIIHSYNDPRIVLVNNISNQGLIFSLNKGIQLAKGNYIARMDGDDIALPERLEIQLNYFEKFKNASVVCSPIIGINEYGKITKDWSIDLETKTSDQIRSTLSKENCIAHPTVMVKSDVIKKYLYNTTQKGSEDWDLWMRLVADGHTIVKTTEKLLKYRYLYTGITLSDKSKQVVELKVLNVKWKFIVQQFAKLKINVFLGMVFYSMLRTLGRHLKLNILPEPLRKVKRIFTINPFKAYKQYNALKNFCDTTNNIDLFFFFPYCHIGGAEKVHAGIVEVFSDKKVVVFFTGISKKEGFLNLFTKVAPSFNVGLCINYPFFKSKSEKLILDLMNHQSETSVFGCNSMFFYDTVLKLNASIKVFDLMHDFRYENEYNITHEFSAQYFRCSKRIFISSKAMEQTKLFYDSVSAPLKEYSKLTLITNFVDIPINLPSKNYNGVIEVLYVGRATSEKRAHLVGLIAEKSKLLNLNFNFTLIGELENAIEKQHLQYVHLTGALLDEKQIQAYYKKAHIILVTSEREGFPLVIMEAMAHGLCTISTPVGDVPKHITIQNGFITEHLDDTTVVNEIVDYLSILDTDHKRLKEISIHAYEYAALNFSKQRFYDLYKKTLGI